MTDFLTIFTVTDNTKRMLLLSLFCFVILC